MTIETLTYLIVGGTLLAIAYTMEFYVKKYYPELFKDNEEDN